ncbi:nad dependent epimerase [Moesziomyces aphidis]|uniref:Nad dependent epimerase n=1 Tax=Moesziomyces aphidis TaxID=84754 RepID=W3VNQ7_MOEAP|nr:nad dependent epimerase [Moesziomyces aphidis]
MLILIAGITGNIGQLAARYALQLGHQVRGFSRSPDKLDPPVAQGLEGFIRSSSYYDVPALDRACAGVDAVICAYSGTPELHLDGQLLLLRAAERAGIKRYLAASHNNDWRKIGMGDVPIYDPIKCFSIHAALTSPIKPLFIISANFLDVFFGGEGQGDFTPAVGGPWDPKTREMHIWGTGDEKWYFTTEADGAKWAVEVVTSANAERGGFVTICSMHVSLNEIRHIYEATTGKHINVVRRGTVEDLEKTVLEKKSNATHWGDWLRYALVLHNTKNIWGLDVEEFHGFFPSSPSSLEEWLKAHPEA